MLPFFTDLYPDELLYSACARYHRWTGNTSLRDTLTELFGNDTAIPSLNFGAALRTLCENIGGAYTPKKMIWEHTLFPIYSPFLPKRRVSELEKQMITADGNGIIAKIGIAAGAICQKSSIAYCPCCVTDDRENFGEAYIHRLHQVQGVCICPKHGCMLRLIKIPVEASRLEYLDIERLQPEKKIVLIPNGKLEAVLKMIGKFANYLLSNSLFFANKETVTLRYKQLLYRKGLLTDTGRVMQKKYVSELQSFYCEKVLSLFNSEIDYNDEYTWPKVVVRRVKRTVHPLRHMLLINFLDTGIKSFFEGIKSDDLFVGKSKKRLKPKDNSMLETYKENIIAIIRDNPEVSRTQLRKLLGREYMYIYRRDNVWLMSHFPDNQKAKGSFGVVNWKQRDIAYRVRLQKAYKDCLADGKRITSTRLIRRAGIQSGMENFKDKLPMAWDFLKDKTQTVEEYQVERCIQIIRKHIVEHIVLKRWQLLRMAGLTEERFLKIEERLRHRLIAEKMEDEIE